MQCGVGVGWLEKEFQVLQASYQDRRPVSDEYLEIFHILWTEDHPEFHGDIRRCQDIGIQQLPFDYRTGRVDDMLKIIEHFAGAIMPAVRG